MKDVNNVNDKLLEALNAYIDGQLPPAQVEKLEKCLAEDPQARRLLAELQQVSRMVGQLPRTDAPEGLADEIHQELERELLLGPADGLTELAGKNHLRLRRLIAAAALIALVGAVVMIVYSVLIRPGQQIAPTEPIIAVSPPTPVQVEIDSSGAAEPPVELAANLAGETTQPAPTFPAIQTPPFGSIQLVLNTQEPYTAQDSINQFLAQHRIDQVIRAQLDQNCQQYAFFCSSEQLREIFQRLKQSPDHNIEIVTSDEQGSSVTVPAVTEYQALRLAAAADAAEKLSLAQSFRRTNRYIAVRSRMDASPEGRADLPDWLTDSLGDLRLLGNVDRPTPQSPGESVVPLVPFSANESAAAGNIAEVEIVETPLDMTIPPEPPSLIAVVLVLQGQTAPTK